MERALLIYNFSQRLRSLMEKIGLGSTSSKAGVKINKLAEISACSHQMARRYALGEALPDVSSIYNIAQWLNVSPGWLLFGDGTETSRKVNGGNLINIDETLLQYILFKSTELYSITNDFKELTSFVMDIINDATHIEADKKIIIKLIDLSINSAIRFRDGFSDKKTNIG